MIEQVFRIDILTAALLSNRLLSQKYCLLSRALVIITKNVVTILQAVILSTFK